jgi:peptidoglycan/xylan/chitin deacetylase (PgdA/CDA1 family)
MSARTVVKRAAALADRVAPPPDGVTVLIYHRVGGGSGSEVDLDAAEFDRQLAHLAEHHRVLTLSAALAQLAAGDSTPATVITFDDGTADFTDVVVPLLERHRTPATLYVATRFVDEQEKFPWGAPPATWAGLREAASTGLVTLGSHTHSHWLLDRADAHTIADDLDRSIELLAEHTGAMPLHFAYPKALPGSPAAEVAVRRRFASAALAGNRVNRAGHADAHRLWRTPVQRSDGFEFFAAKARGGMRVEGRLRAAVARVKYRGSTR